MSPRGAIGVLNAATWWTLESVDVVQRRGSFWCSAISQHRSIALFVTSLFCFLSTLRTSNSDSFHISFNSCCNRNNQTIDHPTPFLREAVTPIRPEAENAEKRKKDPESRQSPEQTCFDRHYPNGSRGQARSSTEPPSIIYNLAPLDLSWRKHKRKHSGEPSQQDQHGPDQPAHCYRSNV